MSEMYSRGEIYYIQSDMDKPPVGSEIWSDRPGLIVSNNVANKNSGVVEIVYLTRSFKKRVSPTHIRVTSGERTAIALCEQIHTVSHSRIKDHIGVITECEQKDIDEALLLNLAIDQKSYKGMFRKWENYIRENELEIVQEQECLREHSTEQAIAILRKQITLLEKERDGYRAIAESKQVYLDELIKTYNNPKDEFKIPIPKLQNKHD